MKRVALVLTGLMLSFCTSAFASPLQNYSQGKFAIDVGLTQLQLTSAPDGWKNDDNGSFGATAGLGGRWALQYKTHKWSANRTFEVSQTIRGIRMSQSFSQSITAAVQEANVLYKLDKNFSVFAGANNLNVTFNGPAVYDHTFAQIGLIATAKLAKGLTGWGLVAAGSDLFTAEAGLGYAFTKNLEFNVFYTYNSYSNLRFSNAPQTPCNAQIGGLGLGLTLAF